MGGIICVLAIIVIVCFIYWKKSQNKRIPEAKKSIEKVNKDDSSKKEKLHKTSDNSNEVSNSDDLERKNKKEVYDASRKKDRGKKRREKKKSNEIKSEVTNEEVKVEKIKADEGKKETRLYNQDIDVKVSKEAEKVKEDAIASKENSSTLEKEVKKEDQVKPKDVKVEKSKADESKKETKLYNQDIDVKVSKEAEKVKEDAKASKENSETVEKEVKKENQVKPKEVKEEKKVKADEGKKETRLYNQDIDVKVSKEAEKVKKDAKASKENSSTLEKEVKKEDQVKPKEIKEDEKVKAEEIKVEKENLKITNEKYSDLVSSLKDNPWQKEDLNTKVKLENTRTKKTISEEEIDDLPLEKIKSSLSPKSVSDFLNVVKTNPTILKRKDDTAYEFTSKDKDEIDLIKKRYNLLDRDIEKITSVLIFDKDNLKLKEVKDILAEGKNRIYMETKF